MVRLYQLSFRIYMLQKTTFESPPIRLPVGCQAAKIRLTLGSTHHTQAIDSTPFIGRTGRVLDAKTRISAVLRRWAGSAFDAFERREAITVLGVVPALEI